MKFVSILIICFGINSISFSQRNKSCGNQKVITYKIEKRSGQAIFIREGQKDTILIEGTPAVTDELKKLILWSNGRRYTVDTQGLGYFFFSENDTLLLGYVRKPFNELGIQNLVSGKSRMRDFKVEWINEKSFKIIMVENKRIVSIVNESDDHNLVIQMCDQNHVNDYHIQLASVLTYWDANFK